MLHDLSALASFIRPTTSVPAASLEVMELCLLDWVICGLGAKNDPIARAMSQYALGAGTGVGVGGCSIFHTAFHRAENDPQTSGNVTARAAAFINATLSHTLDFDDTHFAHIGHVSTVVIPAALAVAQTHGRDFDAFLSAARIGAEVATRVGLWLGRSHYQAGWHQTATSGAFGAAAAAAILMDADPTSTMLNVAGFAAGQKAQFGSAMKPVNAGMAAANGVDAAQMARAGLTGSPDVIPAFLATHNGQGDDTAFNGIGTDWIFDTVSHKYHACCHGTHAMIEAVLSLDMPRSAPIDTIEIRTHPRWMSVCNKPAPDTWLAGKFSYRFLAALILDGGRTIDPEPDGYFPRSGAITAMMERVAVIADDTVSETAAQILVTLKSGEVLRATHDLAAPEPLEHRRAKLVHKGRALVGRAITGQVANAIARRDLVALTRVIRQIR